MTSADVLFLFVGLAMAISFFYLLGVFRKKWQRIVSFISGVVCAILITVNTILALVFYGN